MPAIRNWSGIIEIIIRQRIYGEAVGYDHLNNHEALRVDHTFQTATGKDAFLADKLIQCMKE